mmetsp:Transcript_19496/g.54362  ORF Transcript_19496/g.54362 Transcript_19496/m.54362 type:complete len:242 (+) Transcript_19496:1730-2455(+)
MPRVGCPLRASEIQVDGVAVGLGESGGGREFVWIVGGKVADQRPIKGSRLEFGAAVFFGSSELFRDHHGRVDQLGSVLAAEEPKGKLGGAHHGCDNVAVIAELGGGCCGCFCGCFWGRVCVCIFFCACRLWFFRFLRYTRFGGSDCIVIVIVIAFAIAFAIVAFFLFGSLLALPLLAGHGIGIGIGIGIDIVLCCAVLCFAVMAVTVLFAFVDALRNGTSGSAQDKDWIGLDCCSYRNACR